MILTRFSKNDVFIYAFLTACYIGLRTGEVFALTWDDIDFERKTIKIKRNVYAKNKDDKGKWFLIDTKTETTENYYIFSTEETRKKANELLENNIQLDVIDRIINFKKLQQKD